MKVVHFDSHPDQAQFQTRPGEEYVSQKVNDFLVANSPCDAEVVSCFDSSKFNRSVIDQMPGLKFIVTRGIGMDHVDKTYCDERGIKYCNTEYNRDTIAHHTWALILFAVRHLQEAFEQTKRGSFTSKGIECKGLSDMTLGLIGYGKIAQEVAKIAHVMGVKVLATDRRHINNESENDVDFVPLDVLLRNCDIVSIHCDLNEKTHHLIDDQKISLMKEGVVLVNTSRGKIVDEAAVRRSSNKFSAVMLDVLEDEAKSDNHSEIIMLPNVHVTPHMAHKSEATIRQRWEMAYHAIDEFVAAA